MEATVEAVAELAEPPPVRDGMPMATMPATMQAIPAMATAPGRSPRRTIPASAASRAPVPRPIG